jgi:nicotinamidase-related amidase
VKRRPAGTQLATLASHRFEGAFEEQTQVATRKATAGSKHVRGPASPGCSVALLLIDVINDLEFDGGEQLLRNAVPLIKRLITLKDRARRAGIPAIYVNDNFGHWQSDFQRLIHHCRHDDVRGEPLATALAPADDDYFVLKPKHSAFYATALDILLQHLGVRTLILTGVAGDNCVLFTAHDAYLRDYRLLVPRDCIASIDPAHNTAAIEYMKRVLKVDARTSSRIDLRRLAATPGGARAARGRPARR